MINTPHQAKYIAHKLSSYANDDVAKLAGVFFDAQIEPNPHQIDAALFALDKPFLKGSILADEVGLGKTIEAGIVIAQYWAEQKRKILIVVPSSLRQQWKQEMLDRFNLPATVVDSKYVNKYKAKHHKSPLDKDGIFICSYDFAHRYLDEANRGWDLLICDEAHKLRNFYKPKQKTVAKSIAQIIKFSNKVLLLTATPLQNRLEELYSLVALLEPGYFHSLDVFRERYIKNKSTRAEDDLRNRVAKIAKRTLRRQTNVQYTERRSVTVQFRSSPEEQKLYDLIDKYLERDNLYAFAKSQRHLVSLIIRKRLGSSSYAVASTLQNIILRMQAELEQGYKRDNRGGLIGIEDDIDLPEEEVEAFEDSRAAKDEKIARTREQELAFQAEIDELTEYKDIAESITSNAKAEHLIEAVTRGFQELKPGAAKKAIVFTESTKTQEYLTQVLEANGNFKYVTFNGSNNDSATNEIYRKWKQNNEGSDNITGVDSVDRRKAIIDEFRDNDDAQIMIATEAAAEGVNLQFCSMLINYDLPWNPQRVEQRIGRVHRYGQKFDVVVVNFNNQGNIAEQRILELLDQKFSLFSGVFGASNDVLGEIEDGVDFEKQISDILNRCRTSEEIKQGFDELIKQNKASIDKSQAQAHARVLDTLDPDVQDKFSEYGKASDESFNKFEQMLIDLTKYGLDDSATFEQGDHIFTLHQPIGGAEKGKYFFKLAGESRPTAARQYRYSDSLAEHILHKATSVKTEPVNMTLSISATDRPSSLAKKHAGKSGAMTVKLVSYGDETRGLGEQYIMASSELDDGTLLDTEASCKLLDLACTNSAPATVEISDKLQSALTKQINDKQDEVQSRNAEHYFDEKDRAKEQIKDKTVELDMKIRKYESEINELEKSIKHEVFANKRIEVEKKIMNIRGKLRPLKRQKFDLEDNLDQEMAKRLSKVEKVLENEPVSEQLFEIYFEIGSEA